MPVEDYQKLHGKAHHHLCYIQKQEGKGPNVN